MPGKFPIPVRVVSLPAKADAKNPCVPINAGVAAASGEIVVLTNPEVIHRNAILPAMLGRLTERGPNGYVAAACWGRGQWLCHSTGMKPDKSAGRAASPPSAGLHFCSMLYRRFFDFVGGFDEQYREGQAYEDNDFLWRLDRAGARFAICDDLICDHVIGPRTTWPVGGLARNRSIFYKNWPALARPDESEQSRGSFGSQQERPQCPPSQPPT